MSCASCVAHVDKAVRKVKGVNDVSVNLLTNSMLVSYDDRVTSNDIIKAVQGAGYDASLASAPSNSKTGRLRYFSED